MPLLDQQRTEIEQILSNQIRRKLTAYSPETKKMPFHTRLLGKDRMALFSFIQSINTTLGTSVFEQVAVVLAKPHFRQTVNQYKDFNNTINLEAQITIQRILDELRTASREPDKPKEVAEILSAAQHGEPRKIRQPRIDLFLEGNDGTEYYFDLKTAKPNMDDIVSLKRTMLEWVAIRGAINPKAKIYTGVAIPYNPYEPEPYSRWTLQGMFDLPNETKVANEFWDFLSGDNTYEQLLNVFEKVGVELRPEIDERFAPFAFGD